MLNSCAKFRNFIEYNKLMLLGDKKHILYAIDGLIKHAKLKTF